MKNTSIKLNKILNDKVHGSSELATMLNEYLFSCRNNPTQIKESIKIAKKKLGHFEIINFYLNELNKIICRKNKVDLNNFLTNYSKKEEKKVESIFRKVYPELKYIESVITLSRSKTVIHVLKLWYKKNKKLKVIICESRPKYEGRLMALDLVKAGINVELITDAMMGLYVPKIEAAVIGADSVLMNGNVINKVGSKSLALFCKEYKKSFYVVASGSKFSSNNIFNSKKENPKEVWDKQNNHLKVNNIYFEEIEKKFLTKIFTD